MIDMRVRLRPMGVGDIIDEVIRLYRENSVLLVATCAVLEVPLQIVSVALTLISPHPIRYLSDQSLLARELRSWTGANTTPSGVSYLNDIVLYSVGVLVSAALAVTISHLYLDRATSVGEAYRTVLRHLGALILAPIWAAFRVLLMAITILGIPFAVRFGIAWMLIPQTIILEDTSGGAASDRSATLVRSYWWRAFGLYATLWLLVAIFHAIPGTILVAVIGPGVGTWAGRTVVYGTIYLIINLLLRPIQAGAMTLLFYDLKIRKEAFDLEAMAERVSLTTSIPAN